MYIYLTYSLLPDIPKNNNIVSLHLAQILDATNMMQTVSCQVPYCIGTFFDRFGRIRPSGYDLRVWPDCILRCRQHTYCSQTHLVPVQPGVVELFRYFCQRLFYCKSPIFAQLSPLPEPFYSRK